MEVGVIVTVAVSTVAAGKGEVFGFHVTDVVNCVLLPAVVTGVAPCTGGVTPVIAAVVIAIFGVVIEVEAADAAPVPTPLVAVTVNVYGVLALSPVTEIGEVVPEAVMPPGEDVTV